MPIRSFGQQTMNGSSMPWFGDTTQAAVGLPTNANQTIPITVSSITKYQQGDRIIIDPQQTNQDTLLIQSFTGASTLNCMSEGGAKTHTHSIGAIIVLGIACAEIKFTAVKTNVHDIYLGADNTVTNTGGGSAFFDLNASNTPPSTFNLTNNVNFNAIRTSDGWMAGFTGDKILVAAIVV